MNIKQLYYKLIGKQENIEYNYSIDLTAFKQAMAAHYKNQGIDIHFIDNKVKTDPFSLYNPNYIYQTKILIKYQH